MITVVTGPSLLDPHATIRHVASINSFASRRETSSAAKFVVRLPQCCAGPVVGQQFAGQHRVGEQVAHHRRRGDEPTGNISGRAHFVE